MPQLCSASSWAAASSSLEELTPVQQALRSALGGGVAGGLAMFVNVGALMWLRTTVNYQYRYGMSTTDALRHLYREGGIPRFYKGVGPALLQGPLSRFGDTAANAGMLTLLESYDSTRTLPVWLKTAFASVAAGGFRIILMPIDTCKTVMQVEGSAGMAVLRAKMATSGPTVLFSGAMGAATATLVGHYPWFFVNNTLQETLPQYDRKTQLPAYLMRNAAIGFCASAVSDTISNSIRVLKTTKQSSPTAISYRQAAQLVIDKDGVNGLFLRGLKTKIFANGAQGMLFSVLWRLGQDMLATPR